MKYFLYARKSTEDEERQVMSIETQLFELVEFAKKENIEITEQFVESKSAKTPGREIFNKMIEKIHASKEPIGILAWHPDRLARNSVDGGQIIYLIDIKKIGALRFPTFWFEPTPQGLFMLQVAFGQSKYYSDNLSENVKRGIRQKLRRGEWPGRAPFGYINNLKNHTIEPDPVKAKIVKRMFEEYVTGTYSLESLSERLSLWGVVSGSGRPLANCTIHRILTNQLYIGIIIQNGEAYEASQPPIVPKDLFDKAQTVLKRRSRPNNRRKRHNFPFVGLFRCGECGGGITAQFTKGHGGLYRYYHCTKKFGKCSQGYIQESKLLEQLRARVRMMQIPDYWAKNMLARIDIWQSDEAEYRKNHKERLESEIQAVNKKLDSLVNAFLDNTIEKETYLAKKTELVQSKTDLLSRKSVFDHEGRTWIEPLRAWVISAHHAQKLASSNDLSEIRSFVEKIGTNRRLLSRFAAWDWVNPYDLLSERRHPFGWQGLKESNPHLGFWTLSVATDGVETHPLSQSDSFN